MYYKQECYCRYILRQISEFINLFKCCRGNIDKNALEYGIQYAFISLSPSNTVTQSHTHTVTHTHTHTPGTLLRLPSAPTRTSNSNSFKKWSDGFNLARQPLKTKQKNDKNTHKMQGKVHTDIRECRNFCKAFSKK